MASIRDKQNFARKTITDNARSGVGQLSLVEHALCPLDSQTSLQPGLQHHTSFQFTDTQRRRRTAQVEVSCPKGLSANDEFYLWGLLAITLSQPQPQPEFHATPHYCMRALGLVDAHRRRGGRQYDQFAAAIERLSWVRYGCNAFYDPIRAEHCQVRFGFFSYRLPLDASSNRAWRFYWDAQFFELVQAVGGSLQFDLEIYRGLSPAGRRLFLFVSKVFARSSTTPRMELVHLAVDVLGLSSGLAVKHLLAKTRRVCDELAEAGVIRPLGMAGITKRGKGRYDIMLQRAHDYQERKPTIWNIGDSPLLEPLRSIGLEEQAIARVLKRFPISIVREWVDITLAAQERFGSQFFKRSPAAYFLDNVKHAATDGRTPPDWWHDIRKAEERQQANRDRQRHHRSRTRVTSIGRETFDRIRSDVFEQLRSQGWNDDTALREATRQAQQQTRPESVDRRGRLTSTQAVLDTLPFKLK